MKKVQLLLMLTMCLRMLVAYLRVIQARMKAVPGYCNPGYIASLLASEEPTRPVSPFRYRGSLKPALAIAGEAEHIRPPN